jgi:hypothetical protein
MTLIAEDVLLLLLDDESGKLTATTSMDNVLGGAILIELALAEQVAVTVPERRWASGKVRVVGAPAPADPVLRHGLTMIAEKERRAQDLVPRLGRGRRDELLQRLAERGLVHRQEDRVLGLFPRRRWPAADSAHEELVRRRLHAALVDGAEPDSRTAAIIAILSAVDQAHKVITAPGVSGREIKRRAGEIADGAWAAEAVRDAIQAATAALIAIVVASTVATGAGSS